MDSHLLEILIANWKGVAPELMEAHEAANQLRAIINQPFGTDRSFEAVYLISKICRSFTDILSVLNSEKVSDLITEKPAEVLMNSASLKFGVSEKPISRSPSVKPPKAAMKRKTSSFITPTLLDDGYAWRKYGQKVILNAKYPRNYYRCTHKFDQGCQATKQVQRMEDSLMFKTSLHGTHTCVNPIAPPSGNHFTAPPPDDIIEIPRPKNHFTAHSQITLDSITPTESTNSPGFSFASSNSPYQDDNWDYPDDNLDNLLDHPPIIVSSYRTDGCEI